MDRRYSSSSTASATKKPVANASIRFRNASSSDINLNHRKSFPSASSSSDLATTSSTQVNFNFLNLLTH